MTQTQIDELQAIDQSIRNLWKKLREEEYDLQQERRLITDKCDHNMPNDMDATVADTMTPGNRYCVICSRSLPPCTHTHPDGSSALQMCLSPDEKVCSICHTMVSTNTI